MPVTRTTLPTPPEDGLTVIAWLSGTNVIWPARVVATDVTGTTEALEQLRPVSGLNACPATQPVIGNGGFGAAATQDCPVTELYAWPGAQSATGEGVLEVERARHGCPLVDTPNATSRSVQSTGVTDASDVALA